MRFPTTRQPDRNRVHLIKPADNSRADRVKRDLRRVKGLNVDMEAAAVQHLYPTFRRNSRT